MGDKIVCWERGETEWWAIMMCSERGGKQSVERLCCVEGEGETTVGVIVLCADRGEKLSSGR